MPPTQLALEKAADDFAAKFPDSELRVLLYRVDMNGYQNANQADKMLEVGHKILAIDADDSGSADWGGRSADGADPRHRS